MPVHPPWLRFQAYLVGLPKTGSTSIATVFGNYRTGHEWRLQELVEAGLARSRGELTDEGFLAATGRRLVPPALEMDSATAHHMYADLLADRFPKAVFIHTIRDVRTWSTSLLDMVLRKRLARRRLGIVYSPWETDYLAVITEGTYDLDPASDADDSACLPPLMRYWSATVTRMRQTLPEDRTLTVRTRDIADRLDDLAVLTRVPVTTLRADLTHANRAPRTLDRFAAFDGDAVRAAYDDHCAELMQELFPEEHAAWRSARTVRPADPVLAWEDHRRELDAWILDAIAQHGRRTAY